MKPSCSVDRGGKDPGRVRALARRLAGTWHHGYATRISSPRLYHQTAGATSIALPALHRRARELRGDVDREPLPDHEHDARRRAAYAVQTGSHASRRATASRRDHTRVDCARRSPRSRRVPVYAPTSARAARPHRPQVNRLAVKPRSARAGRDPSVFDSSTTAYARRRAAARPAPPGDAALRDRYQHSPRPWSPRRTKTRVLPLQPPDRADEVGGIRRTSVSLKAFMRPRSVARASGLHDARESTWTTRCTILPT